jgi:hypothetical protein
MRTIYLDHSTLPDAVRAVATKNGVLDVIEDTTLLLNCEVDEAGYEALVEENVSFYGGQQEIKKATKKSIPVEKKKLTSNTK